jgi:hypothetical protein
VLIVDYRAMVVVGLLGLPVLAGTAQLSSL